MANDSFVLENDCFDIIKLLMKSRTCQFWVNLLLCQGKPRGGGFFHSKGTWGCAAREGILFRTSSLAKGVLFGNFSRVRSRQGYAFWEFWSKRCQNSVIFVKKTQLLKNFGLENAKIWQVLPRKCQFRALLKEKLV